MSKSPDRLMAQSQRRRMTETEGDYELDGFRLTEDQNNKLHEAFNTIMQGGGWGCIRLDFKNKALVFIKCETVQMVGSRGYDEY
jgi:hypothetical protein